MPEASTLANFLKSNGAGANAQIAHRTRLLAHSSDKYPFTRNGYLSLDILKIIKKDTITTNNNVF